MSRNLIPLRRARRNLRPRYRPVLELLEARRLLSNVLTGHNDVARTGDVLDETTLTPANVNADSFGLLSSYPVDGQLYAQPLYMAGVALPDGSVHDIVFAATEHDSVYALDAHGGGLLWQTSFIDPAHGIVPFTVDDAFGCGQIDPELGITGTPVIDPNTDILYVVAQTKELTDNGPVYHQQLHALDITTGQEVLGGPVEIQASVPGTGDGGNTVTFDPQAYKARPALLLWNGVVYTSWASHCDATPAHGWVIGYDAATLQQVSVFCTSPNGQLDTIWQGDGGLAADPGGNLYFESGNGTHGVDQGNYSESFVKLTPTGSGLTATDYFSPSNWAQLDQADADLGSGSPVVLPDQPGDHPALLLGGGKDGRVFLLDRTSLGQEGPTDNVVQELPEGSVTGIWGTPAYFDGGDPNGPWVYIAGPDDTLKAFQLTDGLLSARPTSQSSAVFGYPGATPSVSADGTANGIVWALGYNDFHVILYAFDATDLTQELYDSSRAGGRDQLGPGVKFALPTIADGQVYVGTSDSLNIFGLLPANGPRRGSLGAPIPVTVLAGLNPAAVLPLQLAVSPLADQPPAFPVSFSALPLGLSTRPFVDGNGRLPAPRQEPPVDGGPLAAEADRLLDGTSWSAQFG